MANTTTKKSGSAAVKTTKTTDTPETVHPDVSEERMSFRPSEIDIHQYVTVRNGFQGRLVYQSKRTGEIFVWEHFGDEQDMELGELKNAKNSNKKYFINNWFMFDEPWIVEYLGVGQFYKFAITINDFDQIFAKKPEELEDIISKLSVGQKKSVAYRARQMIADGEIDSNKVISVLEKCLGVELVIR